MTISGTTVTTQLGRQFKDVNNQNFAVPSTIISVTAATNGGAGNAVFYGNSAGPSYRCSCTSGSGVVVCTNGCVQNLPSALNGVTSMQLDGPSSRVVFAVPNSAASTYSVGACEVVGTSPSFTITCGSPATYAYSGNPAAVESVA